MDISRRDRFEQAVLPHLDAAHNLARWLTQNDQDAQDVTQEACLRAFRFFEGYQGGNMRAWLLTIVRNTCYTWLQQNRQPDSAGRCVGTEARERMNIDLVIPCNVSPQPWVL